MTSPYWLLPGRKFNPKQPRDPGGEGGGQWTKGPGGGPVGRKEWKGQLTDAEIHAAKMYKRSAYTPINESLRDPASPANAKVKSLIANLDSAIAKGKADEDITAYRGMSRQFLGGRDPNVLIGQQFTDHGFTSTSENQKLSKGFAKAHKDPVLATIRIPEGSRVGYMEEVNEADIAEEASDREILLPHGTTFRITGTQTVSGVLHVDLEIVA